MVLLSPVTVSAAFRWSTIKESDPEVLLNKKVALATPLAVHMKVPQGLEAASCDGDPEP